MSEKQCRVCGKLQSSHTPDQVDECRLTWNMSHARDMTEMALGKDLCDEIFY